MKNSSKAYKKGKQVGSKGGYAAGKASNESSYSAGELFLDLGTGFGYSMVKAGVKAVGKAFS